MKVPAYLCKQLHLPVGVIQRTCSTGKDGLIFSSTLSKTNGLDPQVALKLDRFFCTTAVLRFYTYPNLLTGGRYRCMCGVLPCRLFCMSILSLCFTSFLFRALCVCLGVSAGDTRKEDQQSSILQFVLAPHLTSAVLVYVFYP